VATVEDLLRCIDDPDDDSTRAYEVVDAIVAAGDKALMSRLTKELNRFLDTGHFYGRDVIADTLAGLLGIESLPLLIAASARDLGDDQDTLQSTILDVMWTFKPRARIILKELRANGSAELQKAVAWAEELLSSDLI
jgi:hypothetical protein